MGPLQGIKIIEIVGMGPAPYAAMLLADLGAEVIRVERPGGSLFSYGNKLDVLNRNKKSICVNLKSAEGVEILQRLVKKSDALIEGFRPGTMEKLGLGPDDCLQQNPRLVYGRVTGWGQDGPLAQTAGHDLNYLSLSGVVHAFGRAGEKPVVPLPLIGDFAGGGLFAALGIVSALLEASKSGKGQIIDASIVDGTAHMMSAIFAAQQIGFWSVERGTNLLDSGAPFYEIYTCKDGKYLSVGAIEPKFYSAFIAGIGLANEALPDQMDQSQWPMMKEKIQSVIAHKTRDEWMGVFADREACVAPVLSTEEARLHPHNIARKTFPEDGEIWQPRPAPRFSHTESPAVQAPVSIGLHTDEVLNQLSYEQEMIDRMRKSGVVA